MSDLALQLIEKEKQERTGTLNLGNCDLTEVPDVIKDLFWLERLILCDHLWWDDKAKDWRNNQNQGLPNSITLLPDWLSQLSLLYYLDFSEMAVQTLPELSNCRSLKQLNCAETKITDLIPLANLYTLQWIVCHETSIVNLTPLANLQNLKELRCSSTQVADLTPLANLQNLQQLDCSSTQIADLTPLANFQNLQQLDCSSTQIADLASLANLQNLKELRCSSTQIADLAPLANLQNLQHFDCSSTQIANLASLANLQNLKELHCSETQIADLTPLANLQNLQQLDCSSTQIADLASLANLQNLKELRCYSTQVADLTPLANLQNLQQLDCSSTQVADLTPLANLQNLQQLDCSSTQIADLTPLANLQNLQQLDCSSTQIADLASLANLQNLKELRCSSTQIADIAPLANLNNLKELRCSSTQIADIAPLANLNNLQHIICLRTQVADLAPLTNLQNLQLLYCSFTQVADLTPLAKLHSLRELDCTNSSVNDIQPLIHLIRSGVKIHWEELIFKKGINLRGCPLVCPPVEFAMEGHDAVMEYFDQLGDDGKNLNELKVIFLGEGASGKTSLIRRLRKEDFNPKENQTHGIRIRKTPFDIDGETVDAHLWDFGGQEVMHATHQFFLSQRCIYVLVLNSRTDDKAEYWLKHASSFGGKSPVLVVLNKIDENPSFEVNRKVLSEKYPQIKGYYRLSCQTDEGIEAFEQALQEQVRQSDTRRTPFPTAWLAVKNHFADMDKDYIESAEYRDVCIQNGVDKPFSQNVLLQFLHDLGVIINFRNLKNFDTQILNPLWLTNGVYRVINSGKITENKGLLHEDDFDTVINDPRYANGNTTDKVFHYPRNKLHYIVRVMQEFELCFPLDSSQYVIPQLLPVEEPEFNFNGAVLHFVVRFTEFLPDSIFPRLMVKLHNYIKDDLRWRSGMVLSKPSVFKAEARIRADKEDQKITIDACGDEPRRLLSFVRATLKEITEGFTDLPFEEQVPIPNSDVFWSYTELADMEEMGVTEFPIGKLKKKFSVKDLLDGVEEPSMRDEVAQLPVKAFISYSSKDQQLMTDELLPALAPLRRLNKLQVWYDRTIDAGADWEKEIMDNLAEADIVLCLVSSDFINSEFCFRREFEVALEDHNKDKKTIVPIRLRECDWDDLALSKIQGRPSQWIDSFTNRDKAWTEVAKGLKPVIEQAQQRRKKWLDEKKRENRG